MKIIKTENLNYNGTPADCLGGLIVYNYLNNLSFSIVNNDCNWIKINNINCNLDEVYQIKITGNNDYTVSVYVYYYDSANDSEILNQTLNDNGETVIEIDDVRLSLTIDHEIINLGRDFFGDLTISPTAIFNNPIARQNLDNTSPAYNYACIGIFAEQQITITSIDDVAHVDFDNEFCLEDLNTALTCVEMDDENTAPTGKVFLSEISGSTVIDVGHCAVLYIKTYYNPSTCGVHINKIKITYTENATTKNQYLFGACYKKDTAVKTHTLYFTGNNDPVEVLAGYPMSTLPYTIAGIDYQSLPFLRGHFKIKNEYGYENLFNYNDLIIVLNENGSVPQIATPDEMLLENEGNNIRLKATYTHNTQNVKPTHFKIEYGQYPDDPILIGLKQPNLSSNIYQLDYLISDDVLLFDTNITVNLSMYNQIDDVTSTAISETLLIDYDNKTLPNIDVLSTNNLSKKNGKMFFENVTETNYTINAVDGYYNLNFGGTNDFITFTDFMHDKGLIISDFKLIQTDVFDYANSNDAVDYDDYEDVYYLCNNGFRIAKVDFNNLEITANTFSQFGKHCPVREAVYQSEYETFFNGVDIQDNNFKTMFSVNSVSNTLFINVPLKIK